MMDPVFLAVDFQVRLDDSIFPSAGIDLIRLDG